MTRLSRVVHTTPLLSRNICERRLLGRMAFRVFNVGTLPHSCPQLLTVDSLESSSAALPYQANEHFGRIFYNMEIVYFAFPKSLPCMEYQSQVRLPTAYCSDSCLLGYGGREAVFLSATSEDPLYCSSRLRGIVGTDARQSFNMHDVQERVRYHHYYGT